MKKNLMSVLILALLVVNLIMTAIMMFSVSGAMKSTAALVGKIAVLLDIELASDRGGEPSSLEDMDTYTFAEEMTIPLKMQEGDDKDHYAIFKVILYMNKQHEDYGKYGTAEELAAREELLKSEIITVVRSHTLDEFRNDEEGIYNEMLSSIQKLYGSKFIYRVACSDVKYQ